MKKCLLKFLWVKVPREEIPALKGLLGYWLKLVSRAAFRKEKSSRSYIRDFLYPVLEQFAAGRRFCYPGGAYAVYNNRDHVLNWMGEGSRKIRNHPHFFYAYV